MCVGVMVPKRPRPGLLAPRSEDLLSIDERRARLVRNRIVADVGSSVAPAGTRSFDSVTAAGSVPASSGYAAAKARQAPYVARPTTRGDVPVTRNVRRGGPHLAADQLLTHGLEHLIEDLRRDREAASGRGGTASLLSTWTHFHGLAFGVDSLVLPLTVRKLIAVASL